MKILKVKKAITTVSFLIVLSFGGVSLRAQEGLSVGGTPIYAVKGNGDLLWYSHIGFQTGDFDWANYGTAKQVGSYWAQSLNILKGDPKGGDGVIYRVDQNGDLYWYKHYGHYNGGLGWENGKKIGNGWKSREVISGGGGVLYSLQYDGTLLWQKHEDYQSGAVVWANRGIARKVGAANDNLLNPTTRKTTFIGWNNAKFIFSGGGGVIYSIDDKGDLYWNRHLGFQDGTDRWGERKKIGNGWQAMRQVFSGGGGIIYAVNNEGKLFWFQHTGVLNGANTWMENSGNVIGSGWIFDFVF